MNPGCADFESLPTSTVFNKSGNADTAVVVATGGHSGSKCIAVNMKTTGTGGGVYIENGVNDILGDLTYRRSTRT